MPGDREGVLTMCAKLRGVDVSSLLISSYQRSQSAYTIPEYFAVISHTLVGFGPSVLQAELVFSSTP